MVYGEENVEDSALISSANALNDLTARIPQRVDQEQIHSLLFGETLSWQAIIYDLINTE